MILRNYFTKPFCISTIIRIFFIVFFFFDFVQRIVLLIFNIGRNPTICEKTWFYSIFGHVAHMLVYYKWLKIIIFLIFTYICRQIACFRAFLSRLFCLQRKEKASNIARVAETQYYSLFLLRYRKEIPQNWEYLSRHDFQLKIVKNTASRVNRILRWKTCLTCYRFGGSTCLLLIISRFFIKICFLNVFFCKNMLIFAKIWFRFLKYAGNCLKNNRFALLLFA